VALDFGQHEDVVFERAPLATVLTQVRFPAVLSLLTQAGVAGFQAALRDEFPIFLPPNRSANIALNQDTLDVRTNAPVWRLADTVNENWTVGLATDFVSLETKAYAGIDSFLSRFGRVLTALHRTIRPADSVRVGLRKINHIQAPEAHATHSLLGLVRPEMLGPLAVEHFPAPISGDYGHLSFQDDFSTLDVRFGLQSKEDVTHYVLDMDYYTTQPQAVEATEGLLGVLRHFSDGTTSFFHWALEDEYKKSLGPRSRATASEAS
jgi:uncharacterized protein (TIGR04255 family)